MALAKNEQSAMVVFTSETVETVLNRAGTGEWVVSPKKAGTCKYVVCCRKADWFNRKEGIPHRTAFLVGVIAGLHKTPDSENERGQAHFLIEISEYATVQRPETWDKDARNPVSYKTLGELGIDLRKLKFTPMPPPTPPAKSAGGGRAPMSIAEAKKALAATFGVSPDDVEITIRG
jgi:hypothetical protein